MQPLLLLGVIITHFTQIKPVFPHNYVCNISVRSIFKCQMFKKVFVLTDCYSASPNKAVKNNNSNEVYSLFPVWNCGGWDGWEGRNTRDRQGEVSYHSHERPTVITLDVLGKHSSGAVSMLILRFSCFY